MKATLNRKILLLGLLVTLVYVGLTGLVLTGIVSQGFEDIEATHARKELERVKTVLQDDLEQLAKSARDYAYWDEFYDFLASRDRRFTESNFINETYSNLNLDFSRITDLDNRVVHEQSRRDGPFAHRSLPQLALPLQRLRGLAGSPRLHDETFAGIWPTEAGLLLAVVVPIRNNTQDQPGRGFLTYARLLSSAYVRTLANNSELDFSLTMLAPGDLEREPFRNIDPKTNYWRESRDNQHQQVYHLIKDPAGKPVGVMQLVLSREVTSIGRQATIIGMFTLVTGMIVSLGGFIWFTRRYITGHLREMTGTVIRLADQDDGKTLLPVPGHDEIGILAEKFNQLLGNNRQMTTRLAHLVDIKTGELQQANEALLLAAQVFDNVHESIIITDREGVILRANPAFETVTGYTVAEALGRKANLLRSDRHPREFYAGMWQSLYGRGFWQGEIWNRRKDGEIFPAMLSINSVRNVAGEITHFIGRIEDISLNKLNEERIRYLAFHDPLTGLANRVLFADRTLTGIQRAKRENRHLAMIVLDLDGFKQVNDTYGHAVGDLLLIEVARRLQGVLRAEDTVARFGGDEFTALLPMIDEPLDAVTVAQKILATIETPVVLATHQVQVSASIGISIYPAHGEDYLALFAAADAAMYRVKSDGKAGLRLAGGEPAGNPLATSDRSQ